MKLLYHVNYTSVKKKKPKAVFGNVPECSPLLLPHGYHTWLKDICLAGCFILVLLFTMKIFKY